jgi:hypothetical protein
MTVKSLFITSALALFTLGIASAKSYDITLTSPTMAGASQLKPGDYEVKLQGDQVIITDEANGKSVTVPVTVEHNDKKFDHTTVETTDKNGTTSVAVISLGGSTTRLRLTQ